MLWNEANESLAHDIPHEKYHTWLFLIYPNGTGEQQIVLHSHATPTGKAFAFPKAWIFFAILRIMGKPGLECAKIFSCGRDVEKTARKCLNHLESLVCDRLNVLAWPDVFVEWGIVLETI